MTEFYSKYLADFGKTGFYEADGFFNHATGPWFSSTETDEESNRNSYDKLLPYQRHAQNRRQAQHQRRVEEHGKPLVPDEGAKARAAKVFSIMRKHDPQATWIYQGWVWLGLPSTRQGQEFMLGFTQGVPEKGGLLFLDMCAECGSVPVVIQE